MCGIAGFFRSYDMTNPEVGDVKVIETFFHRKDAKFAKSAKTKNYRCTPKSLELYPGFFSRALRLCGSIAVYLMNCIFTVGNRLCAA